jgi:Domain of unknown function (DUF4476)
MMMVMFVFATFNVQAQITSGAMLKIRDIDGRRIFAVVNGRTFPKVARVLTIPNLQPGATRIKIYVARNGKAIAAPNTMIYGGNLVMRSSYVYRCTVDDYNGMDVQEYCCLDNGGGFFEQDYNDQYGHYDDHNHDWDDNFWTGNHHGGNGNNGNQGVALPVPMNDNTFNAFMQTVRNNNFDSGKEQIIKSQLSNTWITCAQLRQLVDAMQFGSGKLDVAQYGLNSVIDPQNMFSLYDAFTFSSAKTDLAKYADQLAADPNSNYSKMLKLNQQVNNGGGNNNWNNNNGNWNNGNGNNGNWNNGNNGNNNTNWNNGNGNWNNGNSNNNYNQNNVMNDATFNAFLQTLKNNSFDSGKQTILRSQLGNNYFTAQQVRTIVEQFTFDSGKLEAAKAAALRVVDRQNLFVVYDAFDYDSSKRSFADFVATLN